MGNALGQGWPVESWINHGAPPLRPDVDPASPRTKGAKDLPVFPASFEGRVGDIVVHPEALVFVPQSGDGTVTFPWDKIDSFTSFGTSKVTGYFVVAVRYVEFSVLIVRSGGREYRFVTSPYNKPLLRAMKAAGVKRKMKRSHVVLAFITFAIWAVILAVLLMIR